MNREAERRCDWVKSGEHGNPMNSTKEEVEVRLKEQSKIDEVIVATSALASSKSNGRKEVGKW